MDHRPPPPDQPYRSDDERLSAYLDGELSAPEQAQLEARLVVDPELRQLVDELRAVRQQLEILPEYRLQATFAEQVLRRAEQEMLLSPVARETTSVSIAAATTALPVVSAAPIEPAAVNLPHRSLSRRWQRGAIWTAVAAAAVLLLIVTNRPLDPEQEPIAQHAPMAIDEPNLKVTVEHGAVGNTDKTKSLALPDEPQAQDKLRHDRERTAGQEQELETLGAPVEALSKVDPAGLPPAPKNQAPRAAAPKPADWGTANSVADLRQQTPDGGEALSAQKALVDRQPHESSDKRNMAAGERKLLRGSSDALREPSQEKQTTAQREALTPELASLLASAEFSQLAFRSADNKSQVDGDRAEEQVMVVHLTPRPEAKGDSAFESLLASNSIQLADKALDFQGTEQRQTFFDQPALAARANAEPTTKSSVEQKREEIKARQSKDADGAAKFEGGRDGSAKGQGGAPMPELAATLPQEAPPQKEMYYLEAEEGQVQELLRQLQGAPDQFGRLRVAAREIPLADERESPSRLDRAYRKSESESAEYQHGAGFAAGEPRVPEANGKKQAPGQLAQQSPPATPAATPAINAPAPTAELAALPQSAPVAAGPAKAMESTAPSVLDPAPVPPSAPPSSVPSPVTPDKNSLAPAAAAAPAIPLGDAFAPQAGAFSAPSPSAPSQPGQVEAVNGPVDARSNRRALEKNQTAEQVIAYRLRGIEKFNAAGEKELKNSTQLAGGSAGRGAGKTDAGGALHAEFGSSRDRGDSSKLPTKPLAETQTEANRNTADQQVDKYKEPSTAKAASDLPAQGKQDGTVAAGDSKLSRDEPSPDSLTRHKESQASQAKESPAGEKSPIEAAKKMTPATRRVRVLFVIEREPSK